MASLLFGNGWNWPILAFSSPSGGTIQFHPIPIQHLPSVPSSPTSLPPSPGLPERALRQAVARPGALRSERPAEVVRANESNGKRARVGRYGQVQVLRHAMTSEESKNGHASKRLKESEFKSVRIPPGVR